MPSKVRKNFQDKARRLVVKVGSALLTRSIEGEGRFLDAIVFELLARQIGSLVKDGRQVVIVSSGAMAAGSMQLGKAALPQRITEKQAWAALGQPLLMRHYEEAFKPGGIPVAQVLLTHDDLNDRSRYINSRRTLLTLLKLGAVPIVNENDTVAVEEIQVGDNDTLSAQVAALIDADLLVILTTVEGLLDGDDIVPVVRKIDKDVMKLAQGPGTPIGVGGMVTKIEAAKLAGSMGIPTIIASGRKPKVLERILGGEEEGTLFMPAKQRLAKRKHWIAWVKKPKGTLVVDDGAKKALSKNGKSLLPKGIVEVREEFARGEAVFIVTVDGEELARGLAGYSSSDLKKIKGLHSKDIEGVLGYRFDDEAVHRDDLVLSDKNN